MARVIRSMDIEPESATHLPPQFNHKMGRSEWRGLAQQCGITQFGVNLETLHPGAQSSLRHWHTKADEFVYVLEGELTLVTNAGETVLRSGMCVGFQAGDADGHHLINRTGALAQFIVVGSRVERDEVHYPDDDLQWMDGGDGSRRPARKDGSLY